GSWRLFTTEAPVGTVSWLDWPICSDRGPRREPPLDFGVPEEPGVAVVPRKPPALPSVEIKQFSPEEIERSTANLQRPIPEAEAPDAVRAADSPRPALRGLDLHPRIADVATDLYLNGHHNEAVFAASKALINLVRERSGKHALDGAPLMLTVFSKNDPVLAFNELANQTEE